MAVRCWLQGANRIISQSFACLSYKSIVTPSSSDPIHYCKKLKGSRPLSAYISSA